MAQDENIHNRGMLVSLRLSSWTARKYDKKITSEVNASHGAVADAGRFNKMLLPGDCQSYKALMQAIGSVRTEHYANTLAWSDEGWRLLPTANYQNYVSFVRTRRHEISTLLDTFVAEYPRLREAAKTRLNGMYKDEDYPQVSEISSKFGFYYDVSPLPKHGDFRLDGLSENDLQEIEANTQGRVQKALGEAMQDAWKRLHDCVQHIHEKTANPDAIFRDSLIYNARELCDMLGRLNITGDSNLEAMRREVEESLTASEPDDLREDDTLREDTATVAEDILSRMQAFYTAESEANNANS